MFDFIICGSNLTALILAREIATRGRKVCLITNGGTFGAHFSGVNLSGHTFDFGMNLLELSDAPKQFCDFSLYDFNQKNSTQFFTSAIKRYLLDFFEINSSCRVETAIEGRLIEDYIISDNLSFLGSLSDKEKSTILESLKECASATSNFHASKKNVNQDLFLKTSYQQISIFNHGDFFHERFIEPFFRKIFSKGSDSLLALYHRLSWLPLYYPETIKNSILTGFSTLNPVSFSYPKCQSFGTAIRKIVNDLHKNVNIRIHSEQVHSAQEAGSKWIINKHEASEFVWTDNHLKLANLLDIQFSFTSSENSFISIGFGFIPQEKAIREFGTLFLNDSSLIYRISNQTFLSGNLSEEKLLVNFEFNKKFSAQFSSLSKEQLYKEIRFTFLNCGLIASPSDLEILHIEPEVKISFPSEPEKQEFEKFRDMVQQRFKKFSFCGSSLAYRAASFNEQICHALKFVSSL